LAAVLVGATVGQLIIGACVSFTVTRKEQVLVSPAASVTRKTTVVCPFGKDIPVVRPLVCVTALGGNWQLSEPEGVAKLTTALHWLGALPMLMLPGQVMPGAWVSNTVTVKEQVAVCPAMSVAIQVTVVFPGLKVLPLKPPFKWPRPTPGQLSVAIGAVYVTTAVQTPIAALRTTLPGQAMEGGSKSPIATVWEQVLVQPFVPVTVSDTV